jgi:hypothetical protein
MSHNQDNPIPKGLVLFPNVANLIKLSMPSHRLFNHSWQQKSNIALVFLQLFPAAVAHNCNYDYRYIRSVLPSLMCHKLEIATIIEPSHAMKTKTKKKTKKSANKNFLVGFLLFSVFTPQFFDIIACTSLT